MIRTKALGVLAAAVMATGIATVPATSASASGPIPFTCGGSLLSPATIPAGVYTTVTVTGACLAGPGSLLANSVVVAPGATFVDTIAASQVTISGNVTVGGHGTFVMGCGTSPQDDSLCSDNPSATTDDAILGSLTASDPLLLIVHFDFIGNGVKVTGGGGGFSCNFIAALQTPGFVDFDWDFIVGNVNISRLKACWDGFADNEVVGSVTFAHNTTSIPDGNLVGDNIVTQNLSCFGNSPTPHLSDALTPFPNDVLGSTSGQCVGEIP